MPPKKRPKATGVSSGEPSANPTPTPEAPQQPLAQQSVQPNTPTFQYPPALATPANSQAYPVPDPNCHLAHNHEVGQFCFACENMEMPWGNALPIARDDSGNTATVGPPGSILEGVFLQNPLEITIISLGAYIDIQGAAYMNIPGLAGMIQVGGVMRPPRRASERIRALHDSILRVAGERGTVPEFFDIINAALEDPYLTAGQYRGNVVSTFGQNRRQRGGISRGNMEGSGNSNQRGASNRDWGGSARPDSDEDDEPSDGDDNSGFGRRGNAIRTRGLAAPAATEGFTTEHQTNLGPTVDRGTQTPHDRGSQSQPAVRGDRGPAMPRTPLQPNQMGSLGGIAQDEYGDSLSEGDDQEMIFELRETPGKFKNAPPKRGNSKWEFVPGTDTANAKVGEPNPSKFFLCRQKIDDPDAKDCRQYPGWETFDWLDPEDIEALNKSRRQIRKRTSGNIALPRPPWTQREKDELVKQIKQALKAGKTRRTIDWDAIAATMSQAFQGMVQKKGEPLAQTTRTVKVVEGVRYKVPPKLKEDRAGFNRLGKAILNQASKYGDIAGLLGVKGKGKRALDENEEENDDEVEEEEDEVEPQPKRPRKKDPKSHPRGGKKGQGPPPPDTGGVDFAGGIEATS